MSELHIDCWDGSVTTVQPEWLKLGRKRTGGFPAKVTAGTEQSELFYTGLAAKRALEQSMLWGVYVPLALLMCAGVAVWIYRGFKPKP